MAQWPLRVKLPYRGRGYGRSQSRSGESSGNTRCCVMMGYWVSYCSRPRPHCHVTHCSVEQLNNYPITESYWFSFTGLPEMRHSLLFKETTSVLIENREKLDRIRLYNIVFFMHFWSLIQMILKFMSALVDEYDARVCVQVCLCSLCDTVQVLCLGALRVLFRKKKTVSFHLLFKPWERNKGTELSMCSSLLWHQLCVCARAAPRIIKWHF